ncbi:MAG: hypothetical protein R3F37_09815 [Candidatus Competibacteraceae bacterium]
MIWLAQRGCSVLGIELNKVAVADFFRENQLTPQRLSMSCVRSLGNRSDKAALR